MLTGRIIPHFLEEVMKIAIAGVAGKMGKMIFAEVIKNSDIEITGGTEAMGSPLLGKDIGEQAGFDKIGVCVVDSAEKAIENADVLVDFTRPNVTLQNLEAAQKHKVNMVIGTTGFTSQEQKIIEDASKNIAIVQATNMSMGVNILLSLVEKIAETLDSSYDIEILEMHHNKKVDAPSGTALSLGKAAAKGRKTTLEKDACYAREGNTGARAQGEIGFATLRGGDVVGDHTVIFAGEGERIEISHKASSRVVFSKGAVKAAKWVASKEDGLYDMQDVLGL